MKAGKRNVLIKFSRIGGGLDDYGHPNGARVDLGTAWAAVFYGSGQERRAAAGIEAAQTATFEVPANATTRALNVRDQIEGAGGIWNITAIVPIDREGIALTGVRGE